MKDELIKLAIEDATAKARTLTESLDMDIKLGSILKIQYGDPQLIRNFTGASSDLVSSRQLQLTSATQVNFNALTPAAIEMTSMLAWNIEK